MALGECPARCGLTGGCHSCAPQMHPHPVAMPIRLFGWECPRCGAIHSPYTRLCDNCVPPLRWFVSLLPKVV
jgi:hypothetical protein